ncbi:MAG: helix-turn-helix domain-containing protein [Lachnospiraceae bacterium]|nr:helix-turn-helix domain-containing protein [Lachnospiraceae bacterium]
MVADQVIADCIEEVNSISGIKAMVVNAGGKQIAKTPGLIAPDDEVTASFIKSGESEREADGKLFIRIKDDSETAFVLISDSDGSGDICARLAASEIKNLVIAYREKIDRNSFYRNLLQGGIMSEDMSSWTGKLHIDEDVRRCVFVVEPVGHKDESLTGMVRELFYTEAGDYVLSMDDDHVVVIRTLSDDEGANELEETAKMLVDMAGSEAMSDVRVAYGTIADDIKGVTGSYREAGMALEVSKIFYPLKRTIEYSNLGVGRLIYQLPVSLCRLFINEIFGDDIPEEIDEEILTTVNKFFDNSLNVSETSRQLFIHRNTLIYRIEKLQKATGLDVRVFDDALTLKIALMVVNYMRYIEKK